MTTWEHGHHWMRADHRHGQCVSCGEPAPCHVEPGWPDCCDLCPACEAGLQLQEKDFIRRPLIICAPEVF